VDAPRCLAGWAAHSDRRHELAEHSGTFLNISETAIAYRDTAGEHTIQKQDVRSVKLLKNGYRLRNSLIGAAAGAGTGAGIGAASWGKRGFLGGKGAGAAVGAAIGFAGGALVGALLPSHKTIYRASSH
jgi:hypothetical protein